MKGPGYGQRATGPYGGRYSGSRMYELFVTL